MSRPLQATTPSSPAGSRGRHRLDRPSGVRASDLPGVRERLAQREAADVRPRNAFLRWLTTSAPAGRHTWAFLAGSGGRPRTAFAIILSL
ncbi:hypothetical protein [Trujillonella humicola]|uniref:hypothetical protein n=1 Tax=Trujillonella humicola TaxID=3383699 RepID=UPI003905933B